MKEVRRRYVGGQETGECNCDRMEVVDVVHSFTDTMLAARPRWREVTSDRKSV